MENLISIQVDDKGRQVTSAKDLYNFLSPKTRFDKWIQRMLEYGFTESVDFQRLDKFVQTPQGGSKLVLDDYAITLDTAKEISMIQRTEKGKRARQYFIECEKQLISKASKPISTLDLIQLQLDQLKAHEQRMDSLESKVQEIEVRTTTRPDYFTIVGFAVMKKKQVPLTLAKNIGQKAKKLCSEFGYLIDTIPDPRFGKVNQYPRQILEQVFTDMKL